MAPDNKSDAAEGRAGQTALTEGWRKLRWDCAWGSLETATRNFAEGVNPKISEESQKTTVGRHFEYPGDMGRPDRPNIPGGTYHVMNRGNRKAFIFEDDRDRRQFLRKLVEEQEVHDVKILGGTQMGNHFHLAVVTPHGNLSEFMAALQGQFARYFNWRHRYVGHVFQGRFRHVCIEGDTQLLTAMCYIFMNPVTAGLTQSVEDYKWSTYAATVGLRPTPSFLSLDWLETLFPHLTLSQAQARLRRLMSDPKPVAAYLRGMQAKMELNVDPETVKQVLRSYTGEQLQLALLPRVYRDALRPSLDDLLRDTHNDRRQLIMDARLLYGYRNAEIAKALGLMPATISKIFCDERRRRRQQGGSASAA